MSRDHHYIPQVLLKRFSEGGTGKKRFVFQYGKGHCIRTSTRNVAFEKYFHGKSGNLEHQFSEIEGEWGHLLRQIDEHQSSDVSTLSEQINNLVWTLVIRTRYFRESTTSAIEQATRTIGETALESRNKKVLRRRAETMMLERAKLWASQNPIAPQQEIRKLKAQIRKRSRSGEFDEYLKDSLYLGFDWLAGIAASSDITRESHNKLLMDTITSHAPAPNFLKNLTWKKFSKSKVHFILGDTVAFCIDEMKRFRPLIGAGSDFTHCFLPISAKSILVGSQSAIEHAFSPEILQLAAASTSTRYFYGHTKSDNLIKLADELIGRNSEFITSDEINSLRDSFWSASDTKTDALKRKS